jgi:hypothetical protein
VTTLPRLELTDQGGQARRFPSGRSTLLCFLKEDCPTCALTAPILRAAQADLSGHADVWAIAQDADGGRAMALRFGFDGPVLDDSALAASFAYGLDTVPTVILADEAGQERRRFVGFDRAAWQELFSDLKRPGAPAPASVDWQAYPATRSGCGSRSVEPGIAELLAARAEGSPLRARRIEIAAADDPFEFLFDQGLTDGLPVVPPTPERVIRMLGGTGRGAQDVVATVPPNMGVATVEKVAINAVMAGCRPEYLPVVIAAVEAVCSETFNIHGVLATTHFVGPVLIVNGPIRDRIGLNYRVNALGQGSRANSTIGRAVQLVVRNVGGGRPGEIDRAVLGQPGKLGFCFAEWEERSRWEPLHVERGFRPDESTVTAYAGCAPTGIVDQLSRDGESLATSYGLALAAASHPRQRGYGEVVLVVPPEHVDTFARGGWTKARVREQIQRASARPASELARDSGCAIGLTAAEVERLGAQTAVPKFRQADSIKLVVAGGEAGKFAALIDNWAGGGGSAMTTVRIEE